MPTYQAMEMAQEAGLDLVEVAAEARPPVCKIMDFGKFKYEQSKKQKPVHHTKLKTIRLHPKTDQHMVDIRLVQIREFISRGDRVQIEVRFRGREMAHQEFGRAILTQITEKTADIAKVESSPRFEGKTMILILAKK